MQPDVFTGAGWDDAGVASEKGEPGRQSPQVEVRRSHRRTRTISAFRENGVIVVAIPATLSRTEEKAWVKKMVGRIVASEAKNTLSDEDLARRAAELSRRYIPGSPVPAEITWSGRQLKRWGSCTSLEGRIRISERVRDMPAYVRDYVIVHELTHLLHHDHGREFKTVMAGYPHAEAAEAFLAGVTFQEHQAGSAPAR